MFARSRALWGWMAGHRLRYAGGIAAILLSACFLYLQPLICAGVIDYVISGKPLKVPDFARRFIEAVAPRAALAENLWAAGVAVVAVVAISGVFSFLKGKWSAQASEAIARDLRDRLYDHLQHLPCSHFDRAESGDTVQRCTSDVETIRMFLATQVVEIGRGSVLLVGVVPILLYLDVRMALISVAIIPVIVAFAAVFYRKVRSTFQRMDETEGKMTSRLQENITGIRVVRAFARQDHERARFAQANGDYRDRWYGLMRVMAWYWPLSNMLCFAQRGVVLLAGAYFVIQGNLTVGTLFAFISYVRLFLEPVRGMGRILADMGKTSVSLGRVGEILSAPREADPPGAAAGGDGEQGQIVVERLSFAHGDAPVLRDVSFRVEAGQTLAVLGPSGSGKTTLINVLLRLYDYQEGSIRLDGVELRELPRKAVRSRIGSVLQEPFLYARTVRENITRGRLRTREEEMIEAASAACIHDSILRFESGYDTLVGERGVTLSGGQRQRVALARALLRNPPVLILDDAFSAVDTRTESVILRGLRHRRGRRTTIAIAHRITTLMEADWIIVLEDGRIAQEGTHESLLAEEGMYRRLWGIQTGIPAAGPSAGEEGRRP